MAASADPLSPLAYTRLSSDEPAKAIFATFYDDITAQAAKGNQVAVFVFKSPAALSSWVERFESDAPVHILFMTVQEALSQAPEQMHDTLKRSHTPGLVCVGIGYTTNGSDLSVRTFSGFELHKNPPQEVAELRRKNPKACSLKRIR